MSKKTFTGERQNLPQLAKDVEDWLRQQGFEVQSGIGDGKFLIQARKKSTWRSLVGNNQTIDMKIEGTPENYSIDLEAGQWVQNLKESGASGVVAALATCYTLGIAAAWSASERSKIETGLWEWLQKKKIVAAPESTPVAPLATGGSPNPHAATSSGGQLAGSTPPVGASAWHIAKDKKKLGPFSSNQIKELASSGQLLPTDMVHKEGEPKWVLANQVNGLFPTGEDSSKIAPPAVPVQRIVPAAKAPQKEEANVPKVTTAETQTEKAKALSGSGLGKNEVALSPSQQTISLPEPGGPAFMIMEAFQEMVHGDDSVSKHPDIPGAKLNNAKRDYAKLADDELVLGLQDSSTFFNTFGLIVTTQGVHWKSYDGKSTGRMAFEKIDPGKVRLLLPIESGGYQGVCLAPETKIMLSKVGVESLKSIAAFLKKAVCIARGADARAIPSRIDDFVKASALDQAVDFLRDVLKADPWMGEHVKTQLQRLCTGASHHEPAAAFNAELDRRIADRNTGWYVMSSYDGYVEGPFDVGELQAQRRKGFLFADDSVRHFGDAQWHSATQCLELAGAKPICFRDTGTFIPEHYAKCRESLEQNAIPITNLLFFCCSGSDRPITHLALTERHLAQVYVGNDAKIVVDKTSYEELSWRLTKAAEPGKPHVACLTRPSGEVRLSLNEGEGFVHLIQTISQVFYERAKANLAEGRYFYAERLLSQIEQGIIEAAELDRLGNQIGSIAEVIATYQGGHPEFVQKSTGFLRLDAIGLEFIPMEGAKNYMRLGYDRMGSVLEPQKGDFPEELIRDAERQQAAANLLGAAASIFGAVTSHKNMAAVGKGLAGGMDKGSRLGPPSKNRLYVTLNEEGVKHKLLFDVVAGSREQMEEQAQSFWNLSAKVRGRFSKQVTPVANAESPAPSGQILPTNERMASVWEPVVIGCPKCQGKLRAKKPGIVQCPKCQTKIRVDESRFKQ